MDGYADVDLLCYYSTMPPEASFQAAREGWPGGTGVRHDPWNDAGIGEIATVGGVEVQIGHFPLAAVDRDIALVTEGFSTDAYCIRKSWGLWRG